MFQRFQKWCLYIYKNKQTFNTKTLIETRKPGQTVTQLKPHQVLWAWMRKSLFFTLLLFLLLCVCRCTRLQNRRKKSETRLQLQPRPAFILLTEWLTSHCLTVSAWFPHEPCLPVYLPRWVSPISARPSDLTLATLAAILQVVSLQFCRLMSDLMSQSDCKFAQLWLDTHGTVNTLKFGIFCQF